MLIVLVAGLRSIFKTNDSPAPTDNSAKASQEKLLQENARLERLQAQEATFRGIEANRAQLISELRETKTQAEARVLTNKAAFASLVAMDNGAAKAFKQSVSNDDKAISALVGLFGLAYCVDNQDECSALAADLKSNEAHQQKLQEDISTLSEQVGHRILLSNSCQQPVTTALQYEDILLASEGSGQWLLQPNTSLYPKQNDFFLRSRDGHVQYKMIVTSQAGGESAFIPDSLKLNDNSEWILTAVCQ